MVHSTGWYRLVLCTGSTAVALAVAGCGDVAVDVPAPPAAARGACERLAPALPTTLDGHPRRDASPASPLTAVWGDPPISLRCGVPRPAAYSPNAQTAEVNGVAWLPEQNAEGYVFTTVGRTADVEVRVPKAYAPEVDVLVDLAGPVQAAVPTLAR